METKKMILEDLSYANWLCYHCLTLPQVTPEDCLECLNIHKLKLKRQLNLEMEGNK